MNESIEIIGTESLGVRGLSCFITTKNRKILIDPGVALGYIRHALLPHPIQVAAGERVRRRIIENLVEATDVVFSHFHGDHIPFKEANCYQLALQDLPENVQKLRCWSKSIDSPPGKIERRGQDLQFFFGKNFHVAESLTDGPLTFSQAVPHGVEKSKQGRVMMTRIDLGHSVFVHGSDIQLLDPDTIDCIIGWQADVILAAGPPLYLEKLSGELRQVAWRNALHLAKNSKMLILDHHLMRDQQGPQWLEALSAKTGKHIYCAADFMGKKPQLLEADRTQLYETFPVRPHWHEEYERGRAYTNSYLAENV
ncbi:MBL fold metallo-hydrolase [Desulfogranum marinum]|uniref:MBL fold metallo-hydrolase n=1 Tax=Desulfogranum marinum TaxID=453220 RepID=UPI0019650C3B|nr:hypothetical protein [Desulfogranum marinum]MBM9513799.1 hypothetical protein [Desulfogranum marinum]